MLFQDMWTFIAMPLKISFMVIVSHTLYYQILLVKLTNNSRCGDLFMLRDFL